jgi:hypothetical protein
MRKIVIFSRIFPKFTFDTSCVIFFHCLRYLGTPLCFIVSSNIFGSEIAEGKFSKKWQFVKVKLEKDGCIGSYC